MERLIDVQSRYALPAGPSEFQYGPNWRAGQQQETIDEAACTCLVPDFMFLQSLTAL
jgi:hypothetical protein